MKLVEKLKEFLKGKLAELDKAVAESPNKIDDFAWASVRPIIVAWIDGL